MSTEQQSSNAARAESIRLAEILIRRVDEVRLDPSLTEEQRTAMVADLSRQIKAQRAISGPQTIRASMRL